MSDLHHTLPTCTANWPRPGSSRPTIVRCSRPRCATSSTRSSTGTAAGGTVGRRARAAAKRSKAPAVRLEAEASSGVAGAVRALVDALGKAGI